MAQWLFFWCAPAVAVWAEQPDVYIADFYDAERLATSPAEWGGAWQKRTILFFRGTAAPAPSYPGAKGSTAWHDEQAGRGEDRARLRDATDAGMASGFARQAMTTSEAAAAGTARAPAYAVEIERLAAAWAS
eukprot:1692578-Pleurochrysis_carterae.AAC.1